MIEFQSAHPVRGATARASSFRSPRPDFNPRKRRPGQGDFNPRAPCGARLLIVSSRAILDAISIHAPRVGRDSYIARRRGWRRISIHAPRVGRDSQRDTAEQPRAISIHAPRVGRDWDSKKGQWISKISIHAPRVGRDAYTCPICPVCGEISIHAPRVGRDARAPCRRTVPRDFNPRAPCGARQQI